MDPRFSYEDINTEFLSTSGKPVVFDEEAVRQAIRRIITTRKGSRFFNRSFGSRIENLLFEPINELTAASIRSEVFLVLEIYEPRIEIFYGSSDVTVDHESGCYRVDLVFRVRLDNRIVHITEFLSPEVAYG